MYMLETVFQNRARSPWGEALRTRGLLANNLIHTSYYFGSHFLLFWPALLIILASASYYFGQ